MTTRCALLPNGHLERSRKKSKYQCIFVKIDENLKTVKMMKNRWCFKGKRGPEANWRIGARLVTRNGKVCNPASVVTRARGGTICDTQSTRKQRAAQSPHSRGWLGAGRAIRVSLFIESHRVHVVGGANNQPREGREGSVTSKDVPRREECPPAHPSHAKPFIKKNNASLTDEFQKPLTA